MDNCNENFMTHSKNQNERGMVNTTSEIILLHFISTMQQVKSRIQRNKLDLIINEYPNLQLKCCTRIAWNITVNGTYIS